MSEPSQPNPEQTTDLDPNRTVLQTVDSPTLSSSPYGEELLADRYQLGAELGEGGMGSVYRAEQVHPVRRPVAIKLIRTGMDSARVLARFEAERQALAVMDHPSIAKVLDAGTTPDGRPFFAMELVEGKPLTKYCDEKKLSISDRLNIFVQVCQAVQHAHQKGVIHRDLKPGNILVTEVDGKPIPKVIDFGLAKAMDAGILPDVSVEGSILGTPLYMAPEQADSSIGDIDTRADVYALGVILYELLTGTTPIARETFLKAAVVEMLRIVREVEPPSLERRLSSADGLASIAAARQLEPAKLKKVVRGDLEWVTMRCLEKERSRRYETANALALEIQRFLADEPVSAGPPSRWYRARKFVRRNRATVVAGCMVFFALVLGFVGTTLGLIEAQQQRRIAEKREREVREALDAATDEALRELLAGRAKPAARERKYLENALKRYEQFAQSAGNSNEAKAFQASGLHRIGRLRFRLSLYAESEAAYQQALQIQQALVDANPTPERLAALAETHNDLGVLIGELSRKDEEEQHHRTALALRQRAVDAQPTSAEYRFDLVLSHGNLARLAMQNSRLDLAETDYGHALKLLEQLLQEQPDAAKVRNSLALTLDNLANTRIELKRPADAEEPMMRALAIRQTLAKESPDDSELQLQLAKAYSNVGTLFGNLKRLQDALEMHRQAVPLAEKLADENPSVADYAFWSALTLNSLGITLRKLFQFEEAATVYKRATDRYRRLVQNHPSVIDYRIQAAGTAINFGNLLRDLKRPMDAIASIQFGLEQLSAVLILEPKNFAANEYSKTGLYQLASIQQELQLWEEAGATWRKMLPFIPQEGKLSYAFTSAYAYVRAKQFPAAIESLALVKDQQDFRTEVWEEPEFEVLHPRADFLAIAGPRPKELIPVLPRLKK